MNSKITHNPSVIAHMSEVVPVVRTFLPIVPKVVILDIKMTPCHLRHNSCYKCRHYGHQGDSCHLRHFSEFCFWPIPTSNVTGGQVSSGDRRSRGRVFENTGEGIIEYGGGY
jgi:hypothetical protein